ncbi:MAG: hypothetical protein ICV64_11840 [Thermoleophilia bacterium]|nr:hypothetical protein [Thermoleophilia bacterium]
MRIPAVIVLVLALVCAAGFAGDASACSCAVGDPRRMLAESDGAFVGTLVERRSPPPRPIMSTGDPVTLVFEVEQAVKGTLPSRVEVVTATSSASCGLEVPLGQRVGLFLTRDRDRWTSGLCQQIDPERLLAAARPLPAPEGEGPLAVLVGGSFGDARVIALDAAGRTLGYGAGAGETSFLDVCPGSRRALEIARVGRNAVLAVRDLRSLRVVRQQPLRLGESLFPAALDCRSRTGDEGLLFASREAGPLGVIYRVRGARVSVVHRGRGTAVAFGARTAYLTVGRRADRLRAVDLRTGSARALGGVPAGTGALALSPDGRRLAGVAFGPPVGRNAPPSRVVLLDLRSRPLRVLSSSLALPNVSGRVAWLADGGLVFLPGGGDGDGAIRVYDASLRVVSRLESWPGWRSCLRGRVAYTVGDRDRIATATLPSGPIRYGSSLPSPTVNTLVPVPGDVRVSAAAPTRGGPSGRVVPPAPERSGSADWRPAAAIALALAAALALGAVLRTRRRSERADVAASGPRAVRASPASPPSGRR